MKEIALAWWLLFWLVVVIRIIWVARSKRTHQALEDRATVLDALERGAVP